MSDLFLFPTRKEETSHLAVSTNLWMSYAGQQVNLSRSTDIVHTVVPLRCNIGFLTGHRLLTSAALKWFFFSVQTFHKCLGSCDRSCAVTRGSREVCGAPHRSALVWLVSVFFGIQTY